MRNVYLKKVTVLVALLFGVSSLYSQTAASYNFSQSAGTYTAITGGTLFATATDDAVYGGTAGLLPFSFSYLGTSYTSFRISTNGFMTLGNATTPSSTNYTPLSGTAAALNYSIAALGCDLNSTVRYEVIGTSPSRVAVIQWSGVYRYSPGPGSSENLSFQIRLYETSNVIEIVYSPTTVVTSTSATGQVGIKGASNADVNNVSFTNATLTGYTYTRNWNNLITSLSNSSAVVIGTGLSPASGTTLTWTPATCAQPTVSATATALSSTGFTANWTNSATYASGYNVRWRKVDELPSVASWATPTVVAAGLSTYAITGLSASTYYIYSVEGLCSGSSRSNYSKVSTANSTNAAGLVQTSAALPTISSFTPNTNLCFGGGQTVTITGTNFTGMSGAAAVKFNGVNASSYTVVSGTSITAVTPASLTAGVITVTNAAGSVTSSAYTVDPGPTVTATGGTYCSGSGATPLAITASGATTYTWSPATGLSGTTGASVNASPSTATTYTVVGVASGCSSTATALVNVSTKTSVTASASAPSICTGGSFDLTSNGSGGAPVTVFSEGFEGATFPPTGWTLVNAGTGNDWVSSTSYYCSGAKSLTYNYNTTNAANTWMITPAQTLTAGVTYTITFNYYGTGTTFVEKFKVTVGNANTVAGQTTTLIDFPSVTNATCSAGSITYTPSTTGTYYFGFNAYSDADKYHLSVDDIKITAPGTLSYAWSSSPSGFTSSTQNPTGVTQTASTNYTVTATDGTCPSTATVSVGMGGGTLAITAAPASTATTCSGASVTILSNLTGGCSPFTYLWSTGATSVNLTVSPTTTTTYNVTVTDNNGSSASASYVANVFSPTVATISPASASVCGSTPATLTASGGTTYKWSVSGSAAVTGLYTTSAATTAYTAGADQNPMYAKPGASTTYAVTVTDANACTASATRAVSVTPGVTNVTAASSLPAVCPGSSIDLSSSANSNEYTTTLLSEGFETYPPTGWSFVNAGFGNSWASSSTANSGSKSMYYAYAYYDAADAWAFTPSVSLTAGTSYQLSFWYKVSSATYPEKLKVTVGNAASKAAQTTVLWNNNGATSLSNTTWAQATITYTPATSGAVYFAFNCFSNANQDNLYVDDVLLQSGMVSPTYAWSSSPAGFTSSLQNPTGVTPAATTTYTVTATSSGGCSATASTTVNVSSAPLSFTSVVASNPSYCSGDSSNITINYTGGCAPFTYTWSGGAGTTQTVNVKPTSNTTYTVTVTDNNGLSVSGSAAITVNNPQVASATGATRCGTGTLTLSATRTTATDSVRWYAAATGGAALGNGNSFTTPSLSTTTTYYVAEEQVNGAGTTGKLAPVAADGNYITTGWGIVFDVIVPSNLRSVDVYSTTAGTVDIKIMDAAMTTELFSTGNVAVTAGGYTTPNTIPLNYVIAPGTGYRMLIKAYSGVNLARGSSGLAYPYNTGVVNVTSSEWGGTTTSTNYFFYNLQYGTICSGARTPVVATVNTAPAITLSLASPASTCDNVPLNNVTALGTGYTNYAWSPAGTVTNNVADGSDVNLAPTTGTTYSIVATGGGCTNTATLVVNVSNAPNAPTITLSPSATTICDGDIVNLTASGSSALTTPSLATVGTGTVVPGTLSYPNPLSAYYGGVKHQMIYTVAELTGQGMPATGTTIKSIALNVSAFAANACNELTIRLGHTTNSTLSGFLTGTTTSYQQTFTPSATGWVTFTLSTPFSWNGTQNLLVEIVHNQGNSGNGSGTTTLCSTTASAMTYYGASDLITPAGVTSFDALTSYGSSGTSTSRPNMRFGYVAATNATYSWLPTSSSLYTDAGATSLYTGGNTATVYAKPSSSTTYTAVASVGTCSRSTTTTIDVNPRPTGVISGSATICSGATSYLSVALTGTGPWNITYTDGVTPVSVTASSSPKLISVSPASTTTYTLTALSDAKCTAQTSDLSGSAVLTTSTTCALTWLGGTSSNWNDPSNWSPNLVPNSCTSNVSIPAGTPNTPIISTTDIQVGNVSIGNGVSVTLQGAYKLMVCGNWASGTSASVVGGITEFNGSTAQIITGVTQFEVLKLNNSAGATITGAGTVSVYSQYVPKLGPLSIASTSKFKFLSTSASHCATIDMSAANTGIIVGNIQAQRFIPVSGSNQHYISAPVNAIQVSQIGVSGTPGFVVPTPTCDETILAAGSPYGKLFTYDESNGTSCALACWKVITGGTTVNAKGYSAYLTGTTSTPLTLKGKANMSASYSVAGLTNSNWTNSSLQGNSYRSGWALVGNPYLSNLNLAGTHTGFDAQAQVWVTSGPYAGTYQPVMMGSGSAYIAPFQGFMVHKTTTGGTATFTVNRSECTNTSTSFYKTYMSNEGTLTMKLNGNGFNDISTVMFNANATDQFDPQFDANKLPSRQGQPIIATKVGAEVYSVNNLSSVTNVTAIPVEFIAGADGTFTINFDNISTFDPTVNIYLEDLKTGASWIDLRKNTSYTFAALATDSKGRFVLHFTLPSIVETATATCNTAGSITVKQGGSQTWGIVVKDANGNIKGQGNVSQAADFILNNLTTGDYTVEYADADGHTAVKTVNVDGVNSLTASYQISNVTPAINQPVNFTSVVNALASYTWDFGDGSTSTDANPTHTYSQPGTYNVVLSVVNTDGCDYSVASSLVVSANVTGVRNINETNKNVYVYVNNGKMLNIAFVGYNGEVATIQAFNLLGQEILNVKHNTGTKFVKEIETVEAAYVVVGVTIDGKTVSKKVLITKE